MLNAPQNAGSWRNRGIWELVFIGRERNFPNRFAKKFLGSGCFRKIRRTKPGVFVCLPRWALVEAVQIGVRWILVKVEQVDAGAPRKNTSFSLCPFFTKVSLLELKVFSQAELRVVVRPVAA